jgi:hypothetical protein
MKNLIAGICVLLTTAVFGQTNLYLNLPPKVGGNDFYLNTTYQDLNGTAFEVDAFMYYISNIHIIHDGGQELDLSDTVIIVKPDEYNFFLGAYNVTSIESIDFGVGVPQELNHLDIAQWPTDHPLSWQSPSMHWGWTAGYKFMLCDGYGDGTGDGNPNELFQLHDLGDANYQYVSMAVIPTINPTNITVTINCNLDEWLWGADPGTVGVQHGTTGINASTMTNVSTRNVFEVPGDAGIKDIEEGEITFHSIGEDLMVNWSDVAGAEGLRLIDMSGKTISERSVTSGNGNETFSNINSGTYFFYMYSKDGTLLNKIQILK